MFIAVEEGASERGFDVLDSSRFELVLCFEWSGLVFLPSCTLRFGYRSFDVLDFRWAKACHGTLMLGSGHALRTNWSL